MSKQKCKRGHPLTSLYRHEGAQGRIKKAPFIECRKCGSVVQDDYYHVACLCGTVGVGSISELMGEGWGWKSKGGWHCPVEE